jgi:FlaA1/EpsC-like NDP-sugar epimerase
MAGAENHGGTANREAAAVSIAGGFVAGLTGKWSSFAAVKIETYLLLMLLIFGIFKTQRTVKKSGSVQERFFAIRASAFTWLVGVALMTAFVFLPGRQRILFLLPAFVVVVSLAKFWQNGRARLRQEHQERVDIERMKRVN